MGMVPFPSVPHFYFDVLDGDRVMEDPNGIDFADRETAIVEAVAGARDLVAHAIMQNEDASGQGFRIRDDDGGTVAAGPFRESLPGRVKSEPVAELGPGPSPTIGI